MVGNFLENVGAAQWLQGLILDGIVGGVGAVLGFVPQMLVLFLFLAFLEACAIWPASLSFWTAFSASRPLGQEFHSHDHRNRLRCARYHGLPNH